VKFAMVIPETRRA